MLLCKDSYLFFFPHFTWMQIELCAHANSQIHIRDLQAFPWQQRGQDGKDGSERRRQMMDGKGDHLFVEQRQRFAVLTPLVSKQAPQSAVTDTAFCSNTSAVWTLGKCPLTRFIIRCLFMMWLMKLVRSISFISQCGVENKLRTLDWTPLIIFFLSHYLSIAADIIDNKSQTNGCVILLLSNICLIYSSIYSSLDHLYVHFLEKIHFLLLLLF